MSGCDVAVLGAGPYGLAAAAHLARIPGLDVRVFGRPMEFWRSSMPRGMFLQSPHHASNISDPDGALRVEDYLAERGGDPSVPISMETFVEYGLWFHRRSVPADERLAERVEPEGGRFRLTLSDGEALTARRVVVASGIAPFAFKPPAFAGLPRALASHCSENRDVSRFRGKRVIVVGAGQSAFESAALIKEAGASVEILVRQPCVRWHGKGGKARRAARLKFLKPLLYAPTGVGPVLVSRIVSFPGALRFFPRPAQDRFLATCLQPSASWALARRLEDVTISTGVEVKAAREERGALVLTLSDGSRRRVDHAVLATGYKTDLSRYRFLGPDVLARVRTHEGYPRLAAGLESTLPGLHFVGAPATWSYGALMHFIAGTPFTARHLAAHVARRGRG